MLTQRIHEAFEYAAICHAGQLRKGTRIPYLSHLLAVASLVMEAAADGEDDVPGDYEDLVIAALLHDVVEDCGGGPRLDDVRRRFGDRVAEVVDHCTDAKPARGQAKASWHERKRRYLERLYASEDTWAVMVSAADKIHNARAIVADLRTFDSNGTHQDSFWIRFVSDKPGTDLKRRVPEILWYYEALCAVVEKKAAAQPVSGAGRRLGRLAREFRAVLGAMQALAAKAGYTPQSP